MSNNKIVVYGIYQSRTSAEMAVFQLKSGGFRNNDVSMLLPDSSGLKQFAHEKGTKAPEGTAVGVGTGALLGGTLGWLAGIGLLAIPAVGPLIAAGPIMALLAGAGIGGGLGAVTGALVGLGIPEYEAKRFEGLVKKGGILLSVHCDDKTWMKSAKTILENTGATDVSSTTEAKADIEVDPHDRIVSKAS